MNRRIVVLPALTGVLAVALAGCGAQEGPAAGGDTIVVGTTDTFSASKETPAPFDPAAAYDVASWNVLRNTYQSLLRLPRSGTEPEPDAADTCAFTDSRNEQYRCTLKGGQKFSNGSELTAEDVEFSIRRVLAIKDPNGPSSLLSNIDKVEAPSGKEVVFHLKKPDATFPYKLATPAAAIVDSDVYPAKGLYEGVQVVGSGPYTVESVDEDRAVLGRNGNYSGTLELKNKKIEMRFFSDSEKLESALKSGSVDLVNRTLSPEQIAGLEDSDGVNLVEMPGQGIRYLVFNTDAPAVQDKAVRQAVAQLVDRKALVRDVYQRTAEPLYSLVPGGLPSHRNSFYNTYGEPDREAARALLADAGVETPVRLTLTHTTDYYGPATGEEFEALRDQLNRSGLFEVKVKGVPWKSYRPAATDRAYEVYGMGWVPDFPDAENFIAPFFGKDNFLNMPYRNRKITEQLLPQSRTRTERAAATADFVRAQDLIAEDVPVLPLWQGKQYLAARDGLTGVEWALNSSAVLQLWELGRGAQS
ncbi:ABC transporter substrate-binding protein [Streptomyces sp. 549]|uniref:ABC transporter substrate-binding protein n=1 Tax=Streptomyces sp. 549 TaxID=3049076 RepID=UPI0024C220FC|nr:ABC transporter substrate-binding protein [Streptomyces sp. 549]MDK1473544.1 ABC transporter substrate-binding protein [Streptomyces sp. 549]